MEVQMSFENLKGLEYECNKCGCLIKTDFSRTTMLKFCPNCEHGFSCNDMNDPVGLMKQAIKAYESVRDVKIRLVCEEDNDA